MVKQETLMFLFGTAVVSGMVLRPEIKPQQIVVAPNYMPSIGYWSDVQSPVVGFRSGWKSILINEAFKNNKHQLKLKVPCSKNHVKDPEINSDQVLIAPISLPEPIPVDVEDLKPVPIDNFLEPVKIPEGPVLSPFSLADISAIQKEAVTRSNPDLKHDMDVHFAKVTDLPQSLHEKQEDIFIESHIPAEEIKEENWNLVEIPKAPELPLFTMPEIPTAEEVEKLIPKPCNLHEADHVKSALTTLKSLPAPKLPILPELPLFAMPAIPAIEPETFELPKLPELSPPELPLVKWGPTDIKSSHITDPATHKEAYETIYIKEAPKLPSFILPELPVNVELELTPEIKPGEFFKGSPPELHSMPESIKEDYFKHIEIPKAPELSPFSIQESLELFTNMPESEPSLPAYYVPAIIENNNKPELIIKDESLELINLPKAPELPPFSRPIVPVDVVMGHSENEPCEHFKDFEFPSFPESKTENEFIMPAVIPKAPELSPFLMPKIPDFMVIEKVEDLRMPVEEAEELPKLPAPPSILTPEYIATPNLPKPEHEDNYIKTESHPKAPELLQFPIAELPSIEETDKIVLEFEPNDFPKAPELPMKSLVNHFDFPPAPELPEMPQIIMEESCEEDEPSSKLESDVLPANSIVIPEPPVLASNDVTLEIPQSPIEVQKVDEIKEFRPIVLPDAPVLPALYRFDDTKVPFLNENYLVDDNMITSGPAFTAACVQNIISERVLPKIVRGYPKVPVFTYV